MRVVVNQLVTAGLKTGIGHYTIQLVLRLRRLPALEAVGGEAPAILRRLRKLWKFRSPPTASGLLSLGPAPLCFLALRFRGARRPARLWAVGVHVRTLRPVPRAELHSPANRLAHRGDNPRFVCSPASGMASARAGPPLRQALRQRIDPLRPSAGRQRGGPSGDHHGPGRGSGAGDTRLQRRSTLAATAAPRGGASNAGATAFTT